MPAHEGLDMQRWTLHGVCLGGGQTWCSRVTTKYMGARCNLCLIGGAQRQASEHPSLIRVLPQGRKEEA